MTTDLIGIENENGYYPPAFMTSTLADEVNEAIERWNSEIDDEISPEKHLKSIANEYLQFLRRFKDASSRTKALEAAKECRELILRALSIPAPEISLGGGIPQVGKIYDSESKCQVWVIEAPLPDKEEETTDPLTLTYAKNQFDIRQREAWNEIKQKKERFHESPLEYIISNYIFKHDQRPRYVIVVAPKQLILIDRFKWPYRQILRFNLEEIFERKNELTLNVFACFISRKALVPNSGVSLAERLEEESQRHANAVTSSLKKTVRDAIEILGNEVLKFCENKYPKGHPKQGVWIESKDLTQECLRFMYQLLFLFLVEANPKYDIIPLKDPAYNQGYSLEALRRLESIRLRTDEDKKGSFLWESLRVLLQMMGQGVRRADISSSQSKVFELPQMRVSILDPESTPILSNPNVLLRNEEIQKIIRKLSLNQDKTGTGRISYVNLGIGQLGAVYETLIAFTGTVAKQDLLELKPFGKRTVAKSDVDEIEETDVEQEEIDDYSSNDEIDLLAPSYFVEKSRGKEFKPEEIVYEGNEPKVYPKGSFIYRLAGRDRQKSASYYTPEPLARVLVKHTLMERCKDLKADELLDLKILEPAMGSAAFLVETTNQLAEMYLERKQEEIGEQIPQNEYFFERQRVRSYIADRNCFGVDLNPIAIELGEVSLWLNGLHKSNFTPWFGDQLIAGNSLLGARRASYPIEQLKAQNKNDLWFNQKPVEIGWSKSRPKNHVWQFLLPEIDMAKFDKDKSIASIAGEEQEKIRIWRRSGVFTRYEDHEINLLLRLSEEVDKLFEVVADELSVTRKDSNDDLKVWPQVSATSTSGGNHATKQKDLDRLTGSQLNQFNLLYERLKTVMDSWCALWLWPLDKSSLLPSRKELLEAYTKILLGKVNESGTVDVTDVSYFPRHQASLIGQTELTFQHQRSTEIDDRRRKLVYETNIETLSESIPWMRVATEVTEEAKFTHFELYFADIMRDRGGFDIIIGNPPWIKPSWNVRETLTTLDPKLASLSTTQEKTAIISLPKRQEKAFLNEYVLSRGVINFSATYKNMPFVGSGQNNFYRCFIDLSFKVVSTKGVIGYLHQDSHLGDPKAGLFRSHWYKRITKNFSFQNKIKSKNFTEVSHKVLFSLNVYRGNPNIVEFDYITDLYLPSQIDDTYADSSNYDIPLLRTSKGKWDTRGHPDRKVKVDEDHLEMIHSIAERSIVPVEHTRIVKSYSTNNSKIVEVLAKSKSVADLNELKNDNIVNQRQYFSFWDLSSLWDETIDRKNNIIKRNTEFTNGEKMVIQGPFFHVGNPLYKTPNRNCSHNQDYTNLDLLEISASYAARTNYIPGVGSTEYRRQIPNSSIAAKSKHTDYYRVAIRGMLGLDSERRLIAALIPPDVAHVNSVKSVAFSSEFKLINFHSLVCSILLDYIILIKGRTAITRSDVAQLRWVDLCDTALHRGLRLGCLTKAYSSLWNNNAGKLNPLPWSRELPENTIPSDRDVFSSEYWDWDVGLRSDIARRLALVEIDVLVAQAFGLTLDQLIEVYKIYFPVLDMYERETWYDSAGKITWTINSGLNTVGWRVDGGKKPSRALWDKTLKEMENRSEENQILKCTVIDDTQSGGPREVERVFYGPFFKCDRVEDYKRAWKHFEELKGVNQ